jgi:hypothetical protein
MDGLGAPDIADAGFGETEKSYLALFDEITDRSGNVLYRHSSISSRTDGVLLSRTTTASDGSPVPGQRLPVLN